MVIVISFINGMLEMATRSDDIALYPVASTNTGIVTFNGQMLRWPNNSIIIWTDTNTPFSLFLDP